MNLSRTLRGIVSSSSPTKKCLLLRPLSSYSSSTTTKHKTPPNKKPNEEPPPVPPPPVVVVEWPKPSEIPWQSKVANSVHLIGSIGIPVQLEASPDGTYWGVSVLFQDKAPDFPQFWIPIIFEGDLAQSSAFHLKENDLVYVSGQLSGDPPPLTIKHCQTNVQVLVHGISFVKKGHPKQQIHTSYEQPTKDFVQKGHPKQQIHTPYEQPINDFVRKGHPKQQIHTPDEQPINASANTTKVGESVERNWRDLCDDSQMWRDYRSDKINGLISANYPDFKHRDTGWGLWLSRAPEWVLSTIEGLKFDVTTPRSKQEKQNTKKVGESVESNWRDLVNNSQMWRDHRSEKINGLVNVKFPDFRHKGNGRGVWLNSAPEWVLPMIEGLKFDMNTSRSEQEKDVHKGKEHHYMCKKFDVNTSRSEQEKDVHKEESWKDLLENPNKWWDNRLNKKNPKSPDFKNKDTGEALWINVSPAWVRPKLPPLKSGQQAFVNKRDTLLS